MAARVVFSFRLHSGTLYFLPLFIMKNSTLATGSLTLDEIRRPISKERFEEQLMNYDEYAADLRNFIQVANSELQSISSRRSTFIGRLVRLIRWASEPTKKQQAHYIPGVGLELTLIGLFLMFGVGSTVLLLQG